MTTYYLEMDRQLLSELQAGTVQLPSCLTLQDVVGPGSEPEYAVVVRVMDANAPESMENALVSLLITRDVDRDGKTLPVVHQRTVWKQPYIP
jgi:hypothetical protein